MRGISNVAHCVYAKLLRWAGSTGLFAAAVMLCCAAAAPAADTGKLVEKDGKYVFVESIDPATKLLLERAAKQGIITQ